MLSLPVLLAALSTAIVSVSAHGYVQQVSFGGQFFTGFLPFTDPYENPVPDRIIRHIPGDGPILDISSPDLACNQGGETGTKLAADIDAGSPIIFYWTVWPLSHKGVVSTYMASCNGPCSSFSTPGAQWFKLDASGYSNGKWAAEFLMANNNTWTSTIPKELASGQYLIRNEIVALHNTGSPQFFPSCAQLNVKNGGTGAPSASELTNIPGLYNGVVFPNIYSGNVQSFDPPGPSVVSLASSNQNTSSGLLGTSPLSSSSSLPSVSSSSSSPSSSSPASSSYPSVSPKPSSQCRAKHHSNRRSF